MPQGHRVSPVREVGRGFFERAPVLDHNNLDASFVATSTADHRARASRQRLVNPLDLGQIVDDRGDILRSHWSLVDMNHLVDLRLPCRLG